MRYVKLTVSEAISFVVEMGQRRICGMSAGSCES